MSDFRSRRETIGGSLPRAARAAVARALKVLPVVVVTGARQTGKSTLVQAMPELSSHAYLTLDDPDTRDQALRDPSSLLARSSQLILDEVQRAPDLLLAVKRAVDGDRPRHPGRFVLTGSANLLLMSRVSETLAGRAHHLRLWPLTRREQLGHGRVGLWSELLAAAPERWPEILGDQLGPPPCWRRAATRGGLPTPAHQLANDEDRALWFDGYVETYLERDPQVLARIENLGDFRRLMRAAAQRVGCVLNQADLARDVAVSRPTTHRWLNLLETSFQVVRVEPYAINRTQRLVKSPKLYWSDAGLARHLGGGEARGEHLENLVLTDLVAWRELVTPRPDVMFWRTQGLSEVDFVIESRGRLNCPGFPGGSIT